MSGIAGKRFLVTGGAGFIGSHLVDALLAEGAAHVAVVDNFFLGKEENLGPARNSHGTTLTIFREDATDAGAMRAIVDRQRCDIVFNLATKALLYSFFNPAGACRVNLDIALTLGELLRHGAYGRLVHLSSSEVYGAAQRVPMDEHHPMLAETSYAAGKAAADLALTSYVKMFGLDIGIIRPFNNYGPRQNDGDFAAVVPLTIKRILQREKPVIEGDGLQTRDFIFVADTVRAILALGGRHDIKGEIVNLGSGRETTIGEIVGAIADAMGYRGEIAHAPARPADVRRHCADVARAQALIGTIAPTGLADGMSRTVQWYKERLGA